MKWMHLAVILPAVALGASRGSVTGSRFRADFAAPTQMRLKVMSPKGATVEIRSNNKLLAQGTIPFEYTPAQEGFVSVSVVLPSGKRWWGNSVRMKAQTECKLYVADPTGAGLPPATPVPASAEGQAAAGTTPAAVQQKTRAPAPEDSTSDGVSPPAEPGKAMPPSSGDVPAPAQPRGSDQR